MKSWMISSVLIMSLAAGCDAASQTTCADCTTSLTDDECSAIAVANDCTSGVSYADSVCSPSVRGCRFEGCPVGRSIMCVASAVDAGGDDVDAGGAVDDVARCEAAAAAITCPDVDRQCVGRALASSCATERADLLGDALECIRDFSDATGCRSFADPSGADSCIRAALTSGSDRVLEVATRIASLCSAGFPSTSDQATYGLTPPLPTLSDVSLSAVDTCVLAALDCDSANRCLSDRFPAVGACVAP